MADLDTRNKRASAIVLDLSIGRLWPDPDGAIGANDREQTAYVYEGISATPPPSGGGVLRHVNAQCQIYLTTVAYVGTSSTNFQTNWARWLKDGSQAGASTMSATQRWMKLIKNAAGL